MSSYPSSDTASYTHLPPNAAPRACLLLLSPQRDYLAPDGAVAVPSAPRVIAALRGLRGKQFPLTVITQAWLPANHTSFTCNLPGHDPATPFSLPGVGPVGARPRHCVQASRGAELHPAASPRLTDVVLRTGRHPVGDVPSAFRADAAKALSPLLDILQHEAVTDVYVAGPNGRHVIKTAADAKALLDARVTVVTDACSFPEGTRAAVAALRAARVGAITTADDRIAGMASEGPDTPSAAYALGPSSRGRLTRGLSMSTETALLLSRYDTSLDLGGAPDNVRAADDERICRLHKHCVEGGADAVAAALAAGRPEDRSTVLLPVGRNALHATAAAPLEPSLAVEIAGILVDGASLNYVNEPTTSCSPSAGGLAPLHLAAANGSLPLVAFLLSRVAHIDVLDKAGETPLMCAARAGHAHVVAALVKAGARLDIQSATGVTAVMLALAAARGEDRALRTSVALLAGLQAEDVAFLTQQTDADNWNAFHFAAQSGLLPKLPWVRLLTTETTAFWPVKPPPPAAAPAGSGGAHPPLKASNLLCAGVGVTTRSLKLTALHLAVWNRRVETVAALLLRLPGGGGPSGCPLAPWRRPVRRNATTGGGHTALDLATVGGVDVRLERVLLRANCGYGECGAAADEALERSLLLFDTVAIQALLQADDSPVSAAGEARAFGLVTSVKHCGACTYTFAGERHPVVQHMYRCTLCEVDVCLMCAFQCHHHSGEADAPPNAPSSPRPNPRARRDSVFSRLRRKPSVAASPLAAGGPAGGMSPLASRPGNRSPLRKASMLSPLHAGLVRSPPALSLDVPGALPEPRSTTPPSPTPPTPTSPHARSRLGSLPRFGEPPAMRAASPDVIGPHLVRLGAREEPACCGCPRDTCAAMEFQKLFKFTPHPVPTAGVSTDVRRGMDAEEVATDLQLLVAPAVSLSAAATRASRGESPPKRPPGPPPRAPSGATSPAPSRGRSGATSPSAPRSITAALTACLGQHLHRVWLFEHLAEGWKLGATQRAPDRERKLHPFLRAWGELPVAVQTAREDTAVDTLRAIVGLGWSLVAAGRETTGVDAPPTVFSPLDPDRARMTSSTDVGVLSDALAEVEDVELSGDLVDLVDALARNHHALWARKQLDAGVVYGAAGEQASPVVRRRPGTPAGPVATSPLLVPFDLLPPEEQGNHRGAASLFVKALLSLGVDVVHDGVALAPPHKDDHRELEALHAERDRLTHLKTELYRQMLLRAARRSDGDLLEHTLSIRALDPSPDVNARNDLKQSALYLAARAGSVPAVKRLLVAGADSEARDIQGLTPLAAAAMGDHWRVVRLLVRLGADARATDVFGLTCLHHAVLGGALHAARVLCKHLSNTHEWRDDGGGHRFGIPVDVLGLDHAKPLAASHTAAWRRRYQNRALVTLASPPRRPSAGDSPTLPLMASAVPGRLMSPLAPAGLKRSSTMANVVEGGGASPPPLSWFRWEAGLDPLGRPAGAVLGPQAQLVCDHPVVLGQQPSLDAMAIHRLVVLMAAKRAIYTRAAAHTGRRRAWVPATWLAAEDPAAAAAARVAATYSLPPPALGQVFGVYTPLALAVKARRVGLVEAMIDHGGDPTFVDLTGLSPFDRALKGLSEASVVAGKLRALRDTTRAAVTSHQEELASLERSLLDAASTQESAQASLKRRLAEAHGGGVSPTSPSTSSSIASLRKATLVRKLFAIRASFQASLATSPDARRRPEFDTAGTGRAAAHAADVRAVRHPGAVGDGSGGGSRGPRLGLKLAVGIGEYGQRCESMATQQHHHALVDAFAKQHTRKANELSSVISIMHSATKVHAARRAYALQSVCLRAFLYVLCCFALLLVTPFSARTDSQESLVVVENIQAGFDTSLAEHDVHNRPAWAGWVTGELLGGGGATAALQTRPDGTLSLFGSTVVGAMRFLRTRTVLGFKAAPPGTLNETVVSHAPCAVLDDHSARLGACGGVLSGDGGGGGGGGVRIYDLESQLLLAGPADAMRAQFAAAGEPYIDDATRKVGISLTLYHPVQDLWAAVEVAADVGLGAADTVGGLTPSTSVTVVSMFHSRRYPSTAVVVLACALVVVQCVIIGSRVSSAPSLRAFARSGWNYSDLALLALMVWLAVTTLRASAHVSDLRSQLEALGEDATSVAAAAAVASPLLGAGQPPSVNDPFIAVNDVADLSTRLGDLIAVTLVFGSARLVKHLQLLPSAGPVLVAVLTVAVSPVVLLYMFMLGLIVLLFGVAFTVSLGTQFAGFSTLSSTCISLLHLSLGEADSVPRPLRALPAILFIAFLLFVAVILLNLLIGVLYDVYPRARQASEAAWDKLILDLMQSRYRQRGNAVVSHIDAAFNPKSKPKARTRAERAGGGRGRGRAGTAPGSSLRRLTASSLAPRKLEDEKAAAAPSKWLRPGSPAATGRAKLVRAVRAHATVSPAAALLSALRSRQPRGAPPVIAELPSGDGRPSLSIDATSPGSTVHLNVPSPNGGHPHTLHRSSNTGNVVIPVQGDDVGDELKSPAPPAFVPAAGPSPVPPPARRSRAYTQRSVAFHVTNAAGVVPRVDLAWRREDFDVLRGPRAGAAIDLGSFEDVEGMREEATEAVDAFSQRFKALVVSTDAWQLLDELPYGRDRGRRGGGTLGLAPDPPRRVDPVSPRSLQRRPSLALTMTTRVSGGGRSAGARGVHRMDALWDLTPWEVPGWGSDGAGGESSDGEVVNSLMDEEEEDDDDDELELTGGAAVWQGGTGGLRRRRRGGKLT